MTTSISPPLTDLSKPWGVIRFICSLDNEEHEFYSVINKMSGSRLTAFDGDAPSIDDPMPWIKSVFRDIRRKEKVLEFQGTKHFL